METNNQNESLHQALLDLRECFGRHVSHGYYGSEVDEDGVEAISRSINKCIQVLDGSESPVPVMLCVNASRVGRPDVASGDGSDNGTW